MKMFILYIKIYKLNSSLSCTIDWGKELKVLVMVVFENPGECRGKSGASQSFKPTQTIVKLRLFPFYLQIKSITVGNINSDWQTPHWGF